ncbi:MAG: hypothetical protein FWE20_12365 [Defluviitaleaceae bacterium]|nr:hypothetical protein [Defluviitaleaceae bacterium]
MELGLLQPPVVGTTSSGRHIVLSGQSELTAMRELGVRKMDAVGMEMPSGEGGMAKLSLLIMSLQKGPGAICEGMLLQEALENGATRVEISAMLGKSASWLSNRLALVTRLDANVYEMVRGGMLEPRSAQEVARLPADVQFKFAETAVRENMPKSAIEALVAGYNDAGCPDDVKGQILRDPREALKRLSDKRRAVKVGNGLPKSADLQNVTAHIEALKGPLAHLAGLLFNASPFDVSGHMKAIRELAAELGALLAIVSSLVSPGKGGAG